jgi:hypothetical protein
MPIRPFALALTMLLLLLSPGLAAAQSSDFAQPFASPGAGGGGAGGGMGLGGTDPGISADPAPSLVPLALETPPAPIVVELFTSEGCSSCPPANEYQRELAGRRNLLPLSFHVDYWDYIGWKDRFADPAFTMRQRAYAAAQGKSITYTPQMIVAGAIDVVGSDRKAVEGALKKADRRNAMYALALAKDESGRIRLNLPPAPLSVPASLWLVTYAYEGGSDIAAGENRGRHMITTNVVRTLRKIGTWNGAPGEQMLELTEEEIAAKPDACAIIANEAEFGPVVAAAAWDFKDLW